MEYRKSLSVFEEICPIKEDNKFNLFALIRKA